MKELFFDTDPQVVIAICGGHKYRYNQIREWICKKHVADFRKMGNLPVVIRDLLDERFAIIPFTVKDTIASSDMTTTKVLFETFDGLPIETVSMHYEDRHTLCVSVQSGCKMKCAFCATGHLGFKRNLTASEIFGQVLYFPDITNIVFMGMGEPLDNFDALMHSLDMLNGHDFMDFGARRVTISTIGIPDKIRELADTKRQMGISWSLHAVNDDLRTRLMPVGSVFTIRETIDALKYYKKVTNADITIEYILIKGVNMTDEDANGLAIIARTLYAKVNAIPYNPHPDADFERPTKAEIAEFTTILEKKKVPIFVRDSKGADIQAGCGQLAGRRKDE